VGGGPPAIGPWSVPLIESGLKRPIGIKLETTRYRHSFSFASDSASLRVLPFTPIASTRTFAFFFCARWLSRDDELRLLSF
jgi:hypothetical protein